MSDPKGDDPGGPPKEIISNGRVTEPVIQLLNAAFDIDAQTMRTTKIAMVPSLPYDAITRLGKIEYEDPSIKTNGTYSYTFNNWMQMIAHEGKHVQQVGNDPISVLAFGVAFGIDYLFKFVSGQDTYYDHWTEQDAYGIGFGNPSEMDLLLKNGKVESILKSDMSQDEKIGRVRLIGLTHKAGKLEKELDMAKKSGYFKQASKEGQDNVVEFYQTKIDAAKDEIGKLQEKYKEK